MSDRRRIVAFRQDDHGEWIAELECGHARHMRHNPPWMVRPWITTEEGRASFVGRTIPCAQCATRDCSSL
ncbi:MAG: DUF3565 domain-containing protein [Bryobacteraceae bacterium]